MYNKLIQFWKPLLAVIFWGASFIATKIALAELNPQQIIFLRLILAVILLLVIAIYSNKDFSFNLKNHAFIFILSLIAVFHLWIQVTGLQFTSAVNTGWIIGLTPIFMALLGFFVFKEKLNKKKIIGIGIAFGGLWLLVSKGNFFEIGLISNKGDFLVLASSFTWSIYSAVNKKVTLNYSPLMTIFFLFLMMMILIAPFTIDKKFVDLIFHLSSNTIFSILFLGIFCSGIAYVLWSKSLKDMKSATAGSFLYLEPFVTVFCSFLFLKEEITLLIILSGLIITAGVIIVNK